jgi:uncharacterized protein (TIGR03437 family)
MRAGIRLLVLTLAGAFASAAQQYVISTFAGGVPPPTAAGNASGKLPLTFETNQGQTDVRVKFFARAAGYTLFVTSNEAVFAGRDGSVERMKLIGAQQSMRMDPLDKQRGISNYFIGNNPSKWRTNVSNYGRVALRGVYPGIDLIFYGNQGQLEYDWIVAPGADPKQIRVKWEGATQVTKNASGDLVLSASLVQQNPLILQEGKRIEGGYVVRGRKVTFELAKYDVAKPLVIDPVLVYSTFLGGSLADGGQGIALDGSGNAYVTGSTRSIDFPVANPLQRNKNGFQDDVFVTKINAAGSALVYSTYLGGNDFDRVLGIAVDSVGNAYITGFTSSTDFPTANPLQSYNHATSGCSNSSTSCRTGFVAKINAAGSALVYSTYLGGMGFSSGNGIAVDRAGNAYVTGITSSLDFPTANPLQANKRGGGDAFVTKINAAGSGFVYSTYLGGYVGSTGNGIAVDIAGNAYITGFTESPDFPTANPLQPNKGLGQAAFVTKINTAGSALVYSTYLSGNPAGEYGNSIAVDGVGNAYVTGTAESTNFPTVNPLQATKRGDRDAFVTKINAAGSALVYSTYLGGSAGELFVTSQGNGIAVDSAGNAYVTGFTDSTHFPTVKPLQATKRGSRDAFVTKINAPGSALLYSTYLGGGGSIDDALVSSGGTSIAVDTAGNAHVTGYTGSADFPTANPLQAHDAGVYGNAFVLSISAASPSSVLLVSSGAVVNAGSYSAPVAPGGIVSLFGNFLVTVPEEAKTLPIPNTLGGLSLQFSGVPLAPLFFAGPTQTNAQVPWELAGQTQTSVTAIFNGQSSSPQTVNLAAYAPGIFAINGSGAGQGAILDSNYQLVDSTHPATAGSTVLQIFCTGLGPVTNQPATGAASPGSALAWTTTKATVTIGGVAADVSFSGLTPGFVGLYQVNALVPPGSAKGGAVPVTIAIGGVLSNSVTIAVQ